jgi:hypothetical protein
LGVENAVSISLAERSISGTVTKDHS